MTTITKKIWSAELSDATGIKHADTLAIVEAFMELVSKHLGEGNEITLRTFGTFDLRVARGKIGRNPKQPNSEVMIPDRCVVRFKPSKELKSRVARSVHQMWQSCFNGTNHAPTFTRTAPPLLIAEVRFAC
jgi:nucleoid DNA-binding protein